jgi:hypothetical protein
MYFNSKLILTLLVTIPAIFAAVNGECNGRSGICIKTDTCNNYGGTSFSGQCPSDPNDVKCCDNIPCTADDGRKGSCVFSGQCNGEKISGKCPGGNDFKCCVGDPNPSSSDTSKTTTDNTYNGPCSGGGGACINTDIISCDTKIATGRCQGASNVKCCVAGGRPSWYINQGEHKETICTINGKSKSVSSSGCGVASLSMAIFVTTKKSVTPETLFREGYKNGMYNGNGFSHGSLTSLGKSHGVKVSWTDNVSTVYNALSSGKGVIFHVGHESKYHFTKEGHYIFLYGAKKQNDVEKVYVFDPNGGNNYVNVLFPLKKSVGGIEKAKRGQGADFGVVEKA